MKPAESPGAIWVLTRAWIDSGRALDFCERFEDPASWARKLEDLTRHATHRSPLIPAVRTVTSFEAAAQFSNVGPD